MIVFRHRLSILRNCSIECLWFHQERWLHMKVRGLNTCNCLCVLCIFHIFGPITVKLQLYEYARETPFVTCNCNKEVAVYGDEGPEY